MKKWIIGIIVIVIIAVAGGYLYINRSGAAVSNLNGFISDLNKYNLSGAETYTTKDGDLTKLFTKIQGYDGVRQNAVKQWFKAIIININGVKKEDGDTVVEGTIYSPNGVQVASDFQYNLNNLDINSQTIQDSNLNGDFLGAQYSNAFANAVSTNLTNVVGTNVNIKMKREDGNWVIQNDDEVIKALLGGANGEQIFD